MRPVSHLHKKRNPAFGSNATNVVATAGYKKGKAVHKEGRKLAVKVPKLLRKQVKQILEKSDTVGWYKSIASVALLKPSDNLQTVSAVGRTVDTIQGVCFDPSSVRDAASILFNKFVGYGANVVSTNPGQFLMDTLQIKVLEQNVVHRFRNNTVRTMTLKLWDWSPKTIQNTSGINPITFLTNELTRLTPSGAAGATTEQSNYNVVGVKVDMIGFNPKMVPSFNQYYTLDETVVTLEAGKEYIHKLEGPNHKMYDYKKFFSNGSTVSNQQKFTKGTMVAFYLDLSSTDTAPITFGRYTEIAAVSAFGLLVESTYYTKIAMPEQAGFVFPTAAVLLPGNTQQLGMRKSAFAMINFTGAQGAGTVQYIDDENPSTVPTVGV